MSASRPQRHEDRRLNLEQQKTRAKELRDAVRRGDADALERLRSHHPKAKGLSPGEIKSSLGRLSDAQTVIARELGLTSWPKLKAHAEGQENARRAIATNAPAPDADRPTAHIRCGSDIRDRLKEAGFAGAFIEFSEPLWLGPLPRDGVYTEMRARVVAEACGLPEPDVAAKLRREYEDLAAAAGRYRRIVLWFEHDAYDQLCLARALAEFSRTQNPPPVELIVLDRFPTIERFVGLGQLSAAALRSLWEKRAPITPAQLRLGVAVWEALRQPSPEALGAIAGGGTPELPPMGLALRRHLQELPWTTDGLGLTQRLALEALDGGPRTVSEIFRTTQTETEPLVFIGDLLFWNVLREMLGAASPPLAVDAETAEWDWPRRRLALTKAGRDLLSGGVDWMELRPPARWLGGIRIAPDAPAWRWSPQLGRPVRTSPAPLSGRDA